MIKNQAHNASITMVLLFLFFAQNILAQKQNQTVEDTLKFPSLYELKIETLYISKNTKRTLISSPITRGRRIVTHPFFCRLEDQIRDQNNIYFKFRLGSQSYVDYLEQKTHTTFNIPQRLQY